MWAVPLFLFAFNGFQHQRYLFSYCFGHRNKTQILTWSCSFVNLTSIISKHTPNKFFYKILIYAPGGQVISPQDWSVPQITELKNGHELIKVGLKIGCCHYPHLHSVACSSAIHISHYSIGGYNVNHTHCIPKHVGKKFQTTYVRRDFRWFPSSLTSHLFVPSKRSSNQHRTVSRSASPCRLWSGACAHNFPSTYPRGTRWCACINNKLFNLQMLMGT